MSFIKKKVKVIEIRHFRNEKGTAQMRSAIVSGIVYWERAGQLLAIFSLSLVTTPEVFAKVNSTQFPRF